jgi:hypothetical protein
MRGWGRLRGWNGCGSGGGRRSMPGLHGCGLAGLCLGNRLSEEGRGGGRQEQKQHSNAAKMAGQIRSFTRCAKMRSCPMSELERESHLLEL